MRSTKQTRKQKEINGRPNDFPQIIKLIQLWLAGGFRTYSADINSMHLINCAEDTFAAVPYALLRRSHNSNVETYSKHKMLTQKVFSFERDIPKLDETKRRIQTERM